MQKLMQIGFVITSGLIYLFSQIGDTLIGQGFDQLFSIGLLVIVVIMLYKEWKGSRAYNKDRDRRLEDLVRNNTDALNSFRDEIKLIHRRIDKNSERITQQDIED